MNGTVDLDNCAREPIHISGAIQPHGVLFAADPTTLRIEQVSTNTQAVLGLDHSGLLGQALDALFDEGSVAMIRRRLSGESAHALHPLKLHLARDPEGRTYDGLVHLSKGVAVVELEVATTPDDLTFGDFYRHARDAIAALQGATGVIEMCQAAVREIRRLTGFDRVMAYRFDRDDHGHVIAEDKRAELESYLDLHYPASDIPAQARRLYTVNWLRTIVDVAYKPVPIFPALRPRDDQPLDLSFSVLRSVSPIHVEYLRNMGIHASMSISIVVDGKLWGIFICHHYSSRFVPYEIRSAAEFLAQTLSWQIGARQRADLAQQQVAAEAELRGLVQSILDTSGVVDALTTRADDVLRLVQAGGAALIHRGITTLLGTTPPEPDVSSLASWLRDQPFERALESDRLSQIYPPARAWATEASGLLAVPLVRQQGTFLLWFRPEVVQSVGWAGDPHKTVSLRDGDSRLSPRGSFALWKEEVRHRSSPWQPWEVEVAVQLAQALSTIALRRADELEELNGQLRASADQLREADLAKDNFLATISHELRNPLNAMLGWLKLLRSPQFPPDRREQALETVERNARQQAKLVDDLLDVSRIISGKMRLEVQPVSLVDAVEAAVEGVRPSAMAKDLRLDTVLDPHASIIIGDAARLQQIVWNLLTNAIKFTPKGGRIRVLLVRHESSAEVVVADNGEGMSADLLPHVFERFRQAQFGPARHHQGLGLGLSIVRHLAELHGGTVTAHSEGPGRGSTFTLRLPLSPVRPASTPSVEPAPTVSDDECPPELKGLKLLVVDDEPDARELLRAHLTRCGAEVVLASSAPEALDLVSSARPDLLISDIGMPGMDGYTLLRALRQLTPDQGGKTPAIALTAYVRTEERARAFRAGFQAHVPKPIEISELFAIISSLTDRHGS